MTLAVVCILLGALPLRTSAEASVCGQETWYTGYETPTSVTFLTVELSEDFKRLAAGGYTDEGALLLIKDTDSG